MKETRQYTRGVGYFETIFSAVDLATMAEVLKQFTLDQSITEKSDDGEVLNRFISTLIKQLDVERFQDVSSQFFSYPKHYHGILEVEAIKPTEEELNYLKDNIDALLQENIEVM